MNLILGTPVVIPKVFDDIVELAFSEYQINVVASEKVPLNRSLPDFRENDCLAVKYPKILPSTSIVMAVYNEARSILLRAIWSVLNRTPDEILEEIILVDDFSDKPHMKTPLDEYVAENWFGKVRIVRNEKREGLIRARVIGAEKAQVNFTIILMRIVMKRKKIKKKVYSEKGQVILFLDANVEVNDGWVEPLLARVASDRSVIAVPRLDYLNHYNMSYQELNRTLVYGLGWNLYHYEYVISFK